MKSSQHVKSRFLAFIIYILLMFALPIFSCVSAPTALASSHQKEFFTVSTPSLFVYPSPLNEQNCQTSNHRTWTCVVTLEGKNLTGVIVIWNAYTSNSSISISPSKGYLVTLISFMRVTISNIPCMNTLFIFSGQVYGGGGVIPAMVPWSCTQQPTPTPTIPRPTPIPTSQPSPTPKTIVPTSTPVATVIPRLTPTMISSPTPVLSSSSHNDPPIKGNDGSSADIFVISASIFIMLEAVVVLILIALLIRRIIFKWS